VCKEKRSIARKGDPSAYGVRDDGAATLKYDPPRLNSLFLVLAGGLIYRRR